MMPKSTSRNAERSCSPFRKKSLSVRQIRDSAFEDILIQIPVLSKIAIGRNGHTPSS